MHRPSANKKSGVTGQSRQGEVSGDDNGGMLVVSADQMKEELATGLSEGQAAELVETIKLRRAGDRRAV